MLDILTMIGSKYVCGNRSRIFTKLVKDSKLNLQAVAEVCQIILNNTSRIEGRHVSHINSVHSKAFEENNIYITKSMLRMWRTTYQ